MVLGDRAVDLGDATGVSSGANTTNTDYISMEVEDARSKELIDDMDEDQDVADEVRTMVSSVLTADGIHDYPGFLCVCLVILIGDMSRGVMFPSLWPLVDSLGGNKLTQGFAIAAFSFGRVLVNPIFGSWSYKMGYTNTLTLSCSLLLFGTLFYSQVQVFGRIEGLLLAQTLLGVGSGTLGVTRAFVADVTARRNRTTYMAWVTAVQYAGFTVTPAFGALFNKLLQDNEYKVLGFIRINMFTAPAFFMAAIVAFTLVMLQLFFQNRHRHLMVNDKRGKSQKRVKIDAYSSQRVIFDLTVYDCCLLGCMLLNVSTKGSISTFETLGIPLAADYFDIIDSRAGIIVATCGFFGVFCLLNMHVLETRFSDVQIISFGIVVMAVGIGSLTLIRTNGYNDSWRYYVAIFLIYSVGYPIGHTAVIGLFSKIIGRRPQGYLQGWFASAGSLARMFFPILSGFVAHYSSEQALFAILTSILVLSAVFVLLTRETLNLLST